jgi:chromosomal replication initiator protein
MKTEELETIWKKILIQIKGDVSRGIYATLFKQTHLVAIEKGAATIGAPSMMLINLLQSRYQGQIKKLLDSQTGQDIKILFIARSMPNPDKNPENEPPLFAHLNKDSSGRADRVLDKNKADGYVNGRSTATRENGTSSSRANKENSSVMMPVGHLPRVRVDFTFSNIAVSSTNQLAFVSAQNVALNTGKSYNPFFIYGPVGVGKTHLMHAIANEVYRREPDKKIIYITSEEFTNEVVEAIRNNETAKMKRRFRSAFLLLIDDIQFIEGKEKVQEELFHTFNILIDNGSQIVLSSDRPPQEIKKIEKRLSSRFAGGLLVDIEAPDFELKAAIILIKARKYGYELPIDVAKFLAEKAQDARSLEGLLLRIITQVEGREDKITIELARQALGGVIEEKKESLHAEDVIKYVCAFYNLKPTQIKGPKRDSWLVKARQVAMYLLKVELRLTQVEIGNLLGGRDHTTVMYGVDKIRALVENEDIINNDIKRITKQFRG